MITKIFQVDARCSFEYQKWSQGDFFSMYTCRHKGYFEKMPVGHLNYFLSSSLKVLSLGNFLIECHIKNEKNGNSLRISI